MQRPLAALDDGAVEALFAPLVEAGAAALAAEGIGRDALEITASVDLRYAGQSYALELPWAGGAASAQAFHRAHERRYGHHLDLPVELVNVRIALAGPAPGLALPELAPAAAAAPGRAPLHGVAEAVEVWPRAALHIGQVIAGPALVTETVSTTFIAPGWEAAVDPVGNLALTRR